MSVGGGIPSASLQAWSDGGCEVLIPVVAPTTPSAARAGVSHACNSSATSCKSHTAMSRTSQCKPRSGPTLNILAYLGPPCLPHAFGPPCALLDALHAGRTCCRSVCINPVSCLLAPESWRSRSRARNFLITTHGATRSGHWRSGYDVLTSHVCVMQDTVERYAQVCQRLP